MEKPDRIMLTRTLLASLFMAGIFVADLFDPLGIAWGFVYMIAVLSTLWIPGKFNTIAFAIAGVILTILGFYLSPPGAAIHIAITNRILSVSGIIITAYGILKYKAKEEIIHQQKDELENLARELKESNTDLEQFAYVASHDLQEPLRKIQSFGERVLMIEKEKLSDTGKDYLGRVMNASSRMQSLINDLLSYSRLSTRSEPFADVDLKELTEDVLGDLEVTIEKNKVKVDVDGLPHVEADKTQMRQLFQNLISNAIKFRKENHHPEIKIYSKKLNPEPSSKKEYAEITIEDNGIGFEAKYTDKIFQFFQRLEGKKYEGSGIGLAVCKKIVLRHGGTISAKSRPGEGAKFTFTLPLASDHPVN